MSRLLSTILSLRRDPRMLKAPPYLSFLCIVIGVVWLFLLPLEDNSRKTYISENALLPGQVHTYFGGSEQQIFRAYRHEINELADKSNYEVNDKLESILKGVGVKVGRQNYTYHAAGDEFSGENIYGIIQAPRGDATEAIVLVAAWRSVDDELNKNGLALALTLIRYFKRWSLWSKDIILVVPPDSKTGTQAWVDAYHDAHDPSTVSSLPLKSGALQGALAIDYPQENKFEALHIIYDGSNGQLPNLDLVNSVVNIAGNQMGIHGVIQGMKKHKGTYGDRLQTIFRSMIRQGLGQPTGPHSSFMPYHVDAVMLKPYGQGWHDEMAMGRVVEGSFRSLNNLLEHFHQSFFFYLLMESRRFVSIGTYLPSAMLLAANFTIMAIFMWVKSGQSPTATDIGMGKKKQDKGEAEAEGSKPAERDLLLPLAVVVGCEALSVIPLFVLNHLPKETLVYAFSAISAISGILPYGICQLLSYYTLPASHFQLTKVFSMLLLGVTLSTLATVNFSLSFFVGLLAAPLAFVPTPTPRLRGKKTSPNLTKMFVQAGLLAVVCPPMVAQAAVKVWGIPMADVLREASFGWNVRGVYTPVVVWCVWWPAWLVATVNVFGEGLV